MRLPTLAAIALLMSCGCRSAVSLYVEQLRPAVTRVLATTEVERPIVVVVSLESSSVGESVQQALARLAREQGWRPVDGRPLDREFVARHPHGADRLADEWFRHSWSAGDVLLLASGIAGSSEPASSTFERGEAPASLEHVDVVRSRVDARESVRVRLSLADRAPRGFIEHVQVVFGLRGVTGFALDAVSIPLRVVATPLVALGDAAMLTPVPLSTVRSVGGPTVFRDVAFVVLGAVPFVACYGQAVVSGAFVDEWSSWDGRQVYEPLVHRVWTRWWW